jgi:hypothetical protein
VRTGVNGGSELLIFVPRAAHSHELSLSTKVQSFEYKSSHRFSLRPSASAGQRLLIPLRCSVSCFSSSVIRPSVARSWISAALLSIHLVP